MAPLDEYQHKRDFAATPEPAGGPEPGLDTPESTGRFVIQQHSATRLHWDLRLERDGVLVSWALPRGLPWSPKKNHLAVHTEDHPLEYLGFHGDIPEGSYGAGNMFIWDTGTYEAEKFTDKRVVVTLRGDRAEGTYALFQTRGDRDWMIHRKDPPADPDRQPVPDGLRPMLATPGQAPGSGDWATEIRWDGLRVLVINETGATTIIDSDGVDRSTTFPEVRRIGRAIGSAEVILDGVITGVDGDGRPTGAAPVEARLAATSASVVRRLSKAEPVALMAFDLIWAEGHPTTGIPWTDRRHLLDELGLDQPAWQSPRAHIGDPGPIVEAARSSGLAGMVVKKVGSPYRPGKRSSDWIDVRLPG